jgi:hypothetical protein
MVTSDGSKVEFREQVAAALGLPHGLHAARSGSGATT